ncbi:MAG: EamA family transporter, partial [Alphaproteobacteria bacterium]
DGSVSQAATYLYLVPGVSVLFAWLLFGEALSPVQLGGMVVTLIAVALATGAGKVR